jgi:uncharacterized protein (TIGR03084 family)
MADSLDTILEDLAGEHGALDDVVAQLPDERWDAPTPAGGWRVRDQIGHLAFFDQQGVLAATDPERFVTETKAGLADWEAFAVRTEQLGREHTGGDLLGLWRSARSECIDALGSLPEGARLPWYGPPMSGRSFATARLMETWAHGQDVVDGLGLPIDARAVTDRLRHIAFLGVSTRGWSYVVRGREAPPGEVRVELTLPSGAAFEHGSAEATSTVHGTALDFCLVVTQRRNVADTSLDVTGPLAEEWMSIAQCFAGSPTLPPAPRSS